MKTWGEADDLVLQDAESALESLLSVEEVELHDARLGGRGKIGKFTTKEDRTNPPAVGRLILRLNYRDPKLAAITENQLTAAYSPARFPIAVGQYCFHAGSIEFIDRMAPYWAQYCFDAKKFDSSINPWMVRLAINILRAQY